MERFWTKTQPHGNGCIEWTGAKSEKGYGRFGFNGINRKAHHVAYELAHGPIPPQMVIMHVCDNPACVNPMHLRAGTVADNNRDMHKKGRGQMPRPTGENHPNAKLTAAEVAAIRASKTPSRAIAAALGVSPERVQQIRRGEGWQ